MTDSRDAECHKAFEEWCARECVIPSPARYEAWQACWQRFSALEQSHARLVEALEGCASFQISAYHSKQHQAQEWLELKKKARAALAAAQSISSRQGEG